MIVMNLFTIKVMVGVDRYELYDCRLQQKALQNTSKED